MTGVPEPRDAAPADLLSSGHRDASGGARPLWRRPAVRVAVLAGLLCVAAAAAAAGPGAVRPGGAAAARPLAASRPAPAADPVAPVCPPSTIADAGGGQYGVQIKAKIDPLTLFNGWDESQKLWSVTTTGITAEACGLLLLPSLQVVIKPDGLVFDSDPHHVDVTVPGGAHAAFTVGLLPSADAISTISGVAPDGALDLAVQTPLTIRLTEGLEFAGDPFTCSNPVVTGLTTGTSTVVPVGRGNDPVDPWTVTGEPLRGPFVGAQATVVGNDFAIPEFPIDELVSPGCTQGYFINLPFAGQKPDGSGSYYDGSGDTPAGESQVRGVLTITEIDPNAIPTGPPLTVPGT